MAPGAALAFSFGGGIGFAGNALPLTALLAGASCALVAIAIGQLAKVMPSAGGLYTYLSRGIHPIMGFIMGWWYFLLSLILGPAILLLGGFVIQDLFATENVGGDAVYTKWWLWMMVLLAIVCALCIFDVQLSTKVGMALGVIEIIIFLALAVTLFSTHSGDVSLKAFDPTNVAPHTTAWNGIFRGIIFAVLAFVGFEAASALGEESKDPKRIVPRSVVLAAIVVGLFYVFCTWAWVTGSGNDIIGHNTKTGGNDWVEFGKEHWGSVWWLVAFALINSAVACAKASIDTAARVVFSMSRNGALPGFLGKLHPKTQTPYVAVLFGGAFGILSIPMAKWAAGQAGAPDAQAPLLGFFVAGTFLTLVMLVAYILSPFAAIRILRREAPGSFNPLLHGVLPLVGSAVFTVAMYFQFWSNWPLADDRTWWYQPHTFDYVVWAFVISGVAGLAIAVVLKGIRGDALSAALDLVTADHTLDAAPGTELPHAH
jgi:amino acid transporter